jgi:tetratricopeptide (TPR) repeat protein
MAAIGVIAALMVASDIGLWQLFLRPVAPAAEKATPRQMAVPLPETSSIAVLDRQVSAMRKAGLPGALGLKTAAPAAVRKAGDRPDVDTLAGARPAIKIQDCPYSRNAEPYLFFRYRFSREGTMTEKRRGAKMRLKLNNWFLSLLLVAAGALATGGPVNVQASSQHGTIQAAQKGELAPRLQNLGHHKFAVTTNSPRAQQFIDQGLILAYGFNHAEAARSFQTAARFDPDCAMAYWGMALVSGPNINMEMAAEAGPQAYGLIQKAVALKKIASEKEQAYIDALAQRYSGEANADRSALDRAYATAMRALHERYPDDLDAATLYAEALMDLRPWDYWMRDMKPYPQTLEIMRVLESVLARNPNHPGAIHLYIHTVEVGRPELAEAAAERLLALAPGSGHLVHMPSHIFRRLGRYADSSRSNELAIAADEDYITQCRAQGVYPLAYYPHNIHFLWDSASMEGRSRTAIDAARKAASSIPQDAWRTLPMLQQFMVTPLLAYTRFGKWELILKEPNPPEDALFVVGVWHFARGLAFTATGKLDDATQELGRLQRMTAMDSLEGLRVTFSRNGAKTILAIAVNVLSGELAAKRGDYEQAIANLHRGVLLEDNLVYTEPPDWNVPVRQSLGAVLLAAGRPAEAEAVYWQDLIHNRENGWALYGLMLSLRAQSKEAEAAAIESRFRVAWKESDVTLTASRFMDPEKPALAEKK